jgi:hypothetical protein
LAPGEEREFILPVHLSTETGGLATTTFHLTMAGTADVGGEDVEVSTTYRLPVGMDMTLYWTNLRGLVTQQFWRVVDGVNEWGETSALGGISVGSSQGILNVLKKMGDGVLTANDFLGNHSADGGQRLNKQAEAVVAALSDYYHTRTAKQILADVRTVAHDTSVGGVGVFAEWLRDVDKAYTDGDHREVSRLLAEPTATVALGVGVEQVGARLLTKLIPDGLARKTYQALTRGPEADPDSVPYDQLRARELEDLRGMPTGVRVTGETVARAGLTVDEHGWMIDMAKEHGVAFFVRPRPEASARWARLGFNAKPDGDQAEVGQRHRRDVAGLRRLRRQGGAGRPAGAEGPLRRAPGGGRAG